MMQSPVSPIRTPLIPWPPATFTSTLSLASGCSDTATASPPSQPAPTSGGSKDVTVQSSSSWRVSFVLCCVVALLAAFVSPLHDVSQHRLLEGFPGAISFAPSFGTVLNPHLMLASASTTARTLVEPTATMTLTAMSKLFDIINFALVTCV